MKTTSLGRATSGRAGTALLLCATAAGIVFAVVAALRISSPEEDSSLPKETAFDATGEAQGANRSRTGPGRPSTTGAASDAAPVGRAEFAEERSTVGSLRILALRGGKPLPRAVFTVILREDADPEARQFRVRTDDEGAAMVAKLAPGIVEVRRDFGDPTEARILAGEETTVEARIDQGFTIAGKVVDDSKNVIAGASVYFGWELRFAHPPTATADKDGRFEIVGVPVGRHELRSVVEGRTDGFASVLGGEGDTVEVELPSGVPAGTVTLQCVGPDDRVLSNEVLVLECVSDEDSWWPNATATSAEGVIRVPGVPAGAVTFAARSVGGLYGEALVEMSEGASVSTTLRMREGRRISGVVVASDGLTPVADAVVRLTVASDFYGSDMNRKTDSRGLYSFPTLAPDASRIRIEHPQLGSAQTEVGRATTSEPLNLTHTLRSDRMLRVLVVDGEGRPQARVPLSYAKDEGEDDDSNGGTLGDAMSGPDGRATFHDVESGDYLVVCRPHAGSNGWITGVKTAKAQPGSGEIRIELAPPVPATCVIKGRILNEAKSPIGSLEIDFHHVGDDHGLTPTVITDVHGRFECRTAGPGRVTPRIDDLRTGYAELGAKDLVAGGDCECDYGDVVLRAPGAIELSRPASERLEPVLMLFLRRAASPGGGYWLNLPESGMSSFVTAEGAHEVVFGVGFPAQGAEPLRLRNASDAKRYGVAEPAGFSPVHVTSGMPTRIALPRVPCRRVATTVTFATPPSDEEPKRVALYVSFERTEGSWVVADAVDLGTDGRWTHTFPLLLPAGTHVVLAASTAGTVERAVVIADKDAALELTIP